MDNDVDDKILAAPPVQNTPQSPQEPPAATLTRDELIKRAIAAAETPPPEGIVPLVRLGTPVNEQQPPASRPSPQAQAQAQAIYNAGVDKGMVNGIALGLSAALVLFGGYKLYLWTTSCPKVPLPKAPKNPID